MIKQWKKTILALTACTLALGPVMADDLPTFDDGALPSFSSDDGGSLPSFGDDGGFSADAAPASAITINGDAGMNLRFFLDRDAKAGDKDVTTDPSFKLTFAYSGEKGEVEAKLNFNDETLNDHHEDILDELTLRAYLGSHWVVEAGKMKVVWGKGDKVHVLDNFNADDYTNFIFPDYIDRRIAIPMVHVAYNTDSSLRFEGVYTPYMVPTRYATSGPWAPVHTLTSAYVGAAVAASREAGNVVNPSVNNYLGLLGAQTPAGLYEVYQDALPNTKTLKYGQFGFRATGTVGTFDWGASYYFGRMKDASVDAEELKNILLGAYEAGHSSSSGSPVSIPLSLDKIYDYDRLQVFGLEGATVVGGFNLRAELAYNMTNDFDGDEPSVHNNSIGWVFGFDRDLPWNNLNVNIQTQGKVTLHMDKVNDNNDKGVGDVDYNSAEKWTNDRIILDITDSWMHEDLKPELKLVWGIERRDIVVMPSVSYRLMEGLDVELAGLYIYSSSDGEFQDFKDNTFLQVGATYQF